VEKGCQDLKCPSFCLIQISCIYWLKGNRRIEERVIREGLENISISVITECELIYGAYKSSKKQSNLRLVDELKDKINVIHTSDGIAQYYGRIKTELERRGSVLDDADILIASIALLHDAVLVTNNEKHFRRIKGLRVENWA
jgi:predicted nucleic acid-binding protein